jgi:hypothetical protein
MTKQISFSLFRSLVLWHLIAFPCPLSLFAHGFAGERFFPATIATDDPFAASEWSLPTVSMIRQPGSPPVKTIDLSSDLSVLILPNTALTLSEGYQIQKAAGQPQISGFDNAAVNLLYEFFENDKHEAIASLGLTWEIGGTGRSAVGADSFSTFTPTFYFGKGFGDLPDQLAPIRPFAVTGEIGLAIPGRSANRTLNIDPITGASQFVDEPNPDNLEWGFAVEYSLVYLQEHVKDIGLHAPFDRMTPLVEFSMETPVNRGGGVTTGTINPGVLWDGHYCQFGVEAIIPVNSHSGTNVGFVAQVHFFLDDIFPRIFHKPLFGG